jgi:hypothetical protein
MHYAGGIRTPLKGDDMVAEQWDRDPEALRGLQRELSSDSALCDQTFASKHEAFTAGLALGSPALLDAGDSGRRESE